ncbi:MAG: hypothetical protein KAQ87_03635 [Candidatus Pacebacteria bacterium]|nr:hypothetical protein [Candidatus Paceibacterota bacterium]
MPHPGGDKIGLRPINSHLEALRKLGAEIYEVRKLFSANFPLRRQRI